MGWEPQNMELTECTREFWKLRPSMTLADTCVENNRRLVLLAFEFVAWTLRYSTIQLAHSERVPSFRITAAVTGPPPKKNYGFKTRDSSHSR